MAQWHSTHLGIGNPGFSLQDWHRQGFRVIREMVNYNMTALYSHWDGHKGKAVDKEEGNQSSEHCWTVKRHRHLGEQLASQKR